MAAEIHVGDIGTVFRALVEDENGNVVDVSTASTKQFIFRKPNGTNLTKNASFTTDGTDGYIQYTIASGDLSVEGLWRVQGYVVLGGGTTWYGNINTFRVFPNL